MIHFSKHTPLFILLTLVFFINFVSMPATFYPGDPAIIRLESISLLKGKLALDPEAANFIQKTHQTDIFMNPNDGKFYSKFGIMNSLYGAIPFLFSGEPEDKLLPKPDLFALNITHIILSLACAWVLFLICRRFTGNPWIASVYVLVCFYCTFFWNYIRAQNIELQQITIFLALFYTVLKQWDKKGRNINFMGSWALLLALILTKISFAIFIPVLFLFFLQKIDEEGGLLKNKKSVMVNAFFCVLVILIIVANNQIKFGAPLNIGYENWHPEYKKLNAPLLWNIYELLFSARWGVFINFPILLFAVFYFRKFLGRFRSESVIVLSFCIPYILIICGTYIWKGEHSYGPRYFILPCLLLSLPVLFFFESVWKQMRDFFPLKKPTLVFYRTCSVLLLFSLIQLKSFTWQLSVNRSYFLSEYVILHGFNNFLSYPFSQYLQARTNGAFLSEMREFSDPSKHDTYFEVMVLNTAPENVLKVKEFMGKTLASSNLYWWK